MQCVLTFPCSPLDPWYAENITNRSFDLCIDSGAAGAFFTGGRGSLLGTFEEVLCKGNWNGGEDGSLWGGSCMANDTTKLWPALGCGNHGTKHSLACAGCSFA